MEEDGGQDSGQVEGRLGEDSDCFEAWGRNVCVKTKDLSELCSV